MIRLVAGAAVAAALLAAAPRARQPTARPNVVLITLDTFRADRIGADGYKAASTPNLDRLAREGVRFADATTQAPLTAPAHAALLTGAYPTRLGVKDNASTPLPDSALTLAEALKEAGYRAGAFVGAFVLDRRYGACSSTRACCGSRGLCACRRPIAPERSRRRMEVHRCAEAGAVRPADRPRGGAQRARGAIERRHTDGPASSRPREVTTTRRSVC